MNSEYRKALHVLRTSRQDLLASREPKFTGTLKEVFIMQHKDQRSRKSTMEKAAYVDERKLYIIVFGQSSQEETTKEICYVYCREQ